MFLCLYILNVYTPPLMINIRVFLRQFSKKCSWLSCLFFLISADRSPRLRRHLQHKNGHGYPRDEPELFDKSFKHFGREMKMLKVFSH